MRIVRAEIFVGPYNERDSYYYKYHVEYAVEHPASNDRHLGGSLDAEFISYAFKGKKYLAYVGELVMHSCADLYLTAEHLAAEVVRNYRLTRDNRFDGVHVDVRLVDRDEEAYGEASLGKVDAA